MKPQYPPVLLAVLLAFATGCAEKSKAVVPENLTPVQGVVKLNGTPLSDVVVTFCSVDEGSPSASGATDKNGRFRLTTFPSRDGAKPGKYKIIVVDHVSGGYPDYAGKSFNTGVPFAYSVPNTTPLSITLPAPGEIVLQLKSNP